MSGYDDSNLRKLFAELEPKQRKQVFRRAFRKGAAKVRKVAVRNVKGTTLHHKNELSKGVRSVVYKRDAGFRVTVAARAARMNGKGERSMHKNRRGLKKPVLLWAENGTERRFTKSNGRRALRKGKGHATGRMRRYGFMDKTRREVSASIPEVLKKDLADSVNTIAKSMDVSKKTSLSAGAVIRAILMEDPEVSSRVNKIYPIFTDNAELPYIVYRRAEMEVSPQKVGQPGADTIQMEITCYTERYGEGIELAEAVRAALDMVTATHEGQRMRGCYLSNSEEAWENDAYIQQLTFTIKI